MRIDLTGYFAGEIKSREIEFEFSMENTEIDGFRPFISPIKVKAELRSFAGAAELEATLSYDFSMPCSRCMEETLTRFDQKVSHTLVRTLENEEDDDDSYIQVENEAIDLAELFYTDIILNLPVKYLCDEDCKGLCSTCGTNLNKGSCNCSNDQIDPRLEILKKLIEN